MTGAPARRRPCGPMGLTSTFCETGRMWRELVVGLVVGLVVTWLAVILALVVVRPRGSLLKESVRLLPDLLRLLRDLATDRTQPRGVRVRLALLLGYLALPFDLVPDFLPVIG